MRSKTTKVLHELAGSPMLAYVLAAARRLKPDKLAIVVGNDGQTVESAFPEVDYIYQKERLGTAHAVLQAESMFGRYQGNLLVLCGDTPLLSGRTLQRLAASHRRAGADFSLLSVSRDDPSGYGRLIFGPGGRLVKIVEETEAASEERRIKQVNAGVYLARPQLLFQGLKKVKVSAKKGEHFLTDLVEILAGQGKRMIAVLAADPQEALGVNSRQELAEAERVLRTKKAMELMARGTTLIDPERTYIDAQVKVGRDSRIFPNSYILGATVIGRGCTIEPNCLIVDSVLKDEVKVAASSVIEGSIIGARASIGPMAHLRPGSVIGRQARIGNFVEVKKSHIGPRTKAAHLTYLGDSTIGADVNIGAGTITCNDDGQAKHKTIIEDKVFLGSDTMLVAPVRVGKDAVTGAGSTITKDVPARSLAVARAKQVNIPNWRRKKKPG
jgi:bifunctional UDP-N-acetylglucosamine pyrophosphorylase/glucosamine-1-phosphate N-acetyltransferase